MSEKLYILKLNPEFNQEFFDCTFRNGVTTGPVAHRTKARLEQAFGPALRCEEWAPPVAAPPAPNPVAKKPEKPKRKTRYEPKAESLNDDSED